MAEPFITDAEIQALLPEQFHEQAVKPAVWVKRPKEPEPPAVERLERAPEPKPELLHEKAWQVGLEDLDSPVHELLRQTSQALRWAVFYARRYGNEMFDAINDPNSTQQQVDEGKVALDNLGREMARLERYDSTYRDCCDTGACSS